MARIGVFGGSFDPIHQGHLILAERCRDKARLDAVLFVPAFRSPLKDRPQISDAQRLEILKLAIAGHESFQISMFEIEREEPSFTVDTLRHLASEHPQDELFFLMGADSLAEFHRWRDPQEICKLSTLLIVGRPNANEPNFEVLAEMLDEGAIASVKNQLIESPLVDISSTEIRRRVASAESIRFLLPRSVEKYIETQKLYSAPGSK